ncbi:L-threonylcarbamoyladenylate synthase [Streptococcus caviae]|uniref:L-threonylcarbamoyladenylate synthase n=1 Tax=Streptococcus sp. 'caviae' TaxID=1915004 RepID=UPI00094B997E|nr:L-threonylcarbamoyladenylate synthase [Streptococcus sp. 'caviae']OLN82666.1 threonylcarbamoyl-AMP synthase [Streptococcus sp. 'caviae']
MDKIEEALLAGQAVILPTETVYGLFARALDAEAVANVYALKKRPPEKAMNLNVASLADILAFSKEVPAYLPELYQAFLPGPLTIILKANEKVPVWVNSGLPTVGFRVPSHPLTLAYIKKTGPLIGPSANLSGQTSGLDYASVQASFDHQLLGIQDDEAIGKVDSTILDISGPTAKILRQGDITQADIEARVSAVKF